jgi:uncharacterized protein with PIN domain
MPGAVMGGFRGEGPNPMNQRARRSCPECGGPVVWLKVGGELSAKVKGALKNAVATMETEDLDIWQCQTCGEAGFMERQLHNF